MMMMNAAAVTVIMDDANEAAVEIQIAVTGVGNVEAMRSVGAEGAAV